MKIVKVIYTTKQEFVEQNKKNIQTVMAELQQLNQKDMLYHVCIGSDGKTFTHTAFFNNEETEKNLLSLPAFKTFQEQLKASDPEVAPKSEQLSLVGASKNLFD